MKITQREQKIIDQLITRFQEQLKDESGEIANELVMEEGVKDLTDEQIFARFDELHHTIYQEVVKGL